MFVSLSGDIGKKLIPYGDVNNRNYNDLRAEALSPLSPSRPQPNFFNPILPFYALRNFEICSIVFFVAP